LKEEITKLDPFLVRILEKLNNIEKYLDQEFWNQVVKESYNVVILCLECLIMDNLGTKILEQLQRDRKIYLDPLIHVLESKGFEIENRRELEKLRYYRNKVEHEYEEAKAYDAEWAFKAAKDLVSKYYPQIITELEKRSLEKEISEVSEVEEGRRIKVADEVWIACALLHIENPKREDFSTREIVERVRKENIHGKLRPGIFVHVSTQCVANKRPNPGRYRILYETKPGRRRLFKKGDYYHPEREGGKIKPNKNEIPQKYWYLLEWYEKQYDI